MRPASSLDSSAWSRARNTPRASRPATTALGATSSRSGSAGWAGSACAIPVASRQKVANAGRIDRGMRTTCRMSANHRRKCRTAVTPGRGLSAPNSGGTATHWPGPAMHACMRIGQLPAACHSSVPAGMGALAACSGVRPSRCRSARRIPSISNTPPTQWFRSPPRKPSCYGSRTLPAKVASAALSIAY
ncbi:hypothetical protein D3C78_1274150 [compost metagenome]